MFCCCTNKVHGLYCLVNAKIQLYENDRQNQPVRKSCQLSSPIILHVFVDPVCRRDALRSHQ